MSPPERKATQFGTPGSRCASQRTNVGGAPVASTTPNRLTRSWPSSHCAEPTEDTADFAITQHSSLETPESQPSQIIPDIESHTGPELATPPSPPTVSQQAEVNASPSLPDDSDLDTMSYHSYTHYTDGRNTESHIRFFLSTWQANHSTTWLTAKEIDASKIAEFTLSLYGPAELWYSGHDLGSLPHSKMSAPSFWNYSTKRSRSGNCFVNFIRSARDLTKPCPRLFAAFKTCTANSHKKYL